MSVSDWSVNPGDNSGPPPNGAPEGMAPGGVNDCLRQIMADVRAFYDNAARLDAISNITGQLSVASARVFGSTFLIKPVDETSAVSQDDDDLTTTVTPGTYAVDGIFIATTTVTTNLVFQFAAPTLIRSNLFVTASSGGFSEAIFGKDDITTAFPIAAAVATGMQCRVSGMFVTGAPGTFKLTWSSGSSMTLKAGSWLRLTRVA